MSFDSDTSADELGHAFAVLLKASTIAPDLTDLQHALAAFYERDRLSRKDRDIDAWEDEASDDQLLEKNDPAVWMVRASALLLRNKLRFGLQWQRLLNQRLPQIRETLGDYRSEVDPLPELRSKLLDEIRVCLQEGAELISDHGRRVQQEIEALLDDLLPDETGTCSARDRPLRRARQSR
jgi:hypothetical protein